MSANGPGSRHVEAPARLTSRPALAVAALTVLALGVRVPGMDQSLFGDELFTWAAIHHRDLHGLLHFIRAQEASPPLYFLIAWLLAKLGDPTPWIRLPSLLAGTATVPLTYLVGVRTVGRRAALIGSALVALSPFAIFYSNEGRTYALTAFLVMASTYALLRAVASPQRRWLVAYAVLACAALYAHYTAGFVIAAQAVWALVAHRERFRELVVANVAIVVGYLPWLPFIQGGYTLKLIDILYRLTLDSYVRGALGLIPGSAYVPLRDLPGPVGWVLIGAGLAIALAGFIHRLLQTRRAAPSSSLILVILLALATPVGIPLYSLVRTSIFLPRNLFPSAAALALLIGALIASLERRLMWVAAALVLCGVSIGTVKALEPSAQRPAMADVAQAVEGRGRSAYPVLQVAIFPGQPSRSLQVQLHRPERGVFVPLDARAWARAAAGHPRAYVVAPTLLVPGRFKPPSVLSGPPRLRLVARRVFPGFFPTALYTYGSGEAPRSAPADTSG